MSIFNVLEVHARRYDPGWGEPFWVADLSIDGRPLVDMVRDIEEPFARREGHHDLAGSYAPLPIDDVYLPSKHLLGQPVPYGMSDGRAALLGCTCTVVDCWPLFAAIEVFEDRVVWRDFENPWRGPKWSKVEEQWRYDGLGPFVFRLAQYESALQRPLNLGKCSSQSLGRTHQFLHYVDGQRTISERGSKIVDQGPPAETLANDVRIMFVSFP